MNHGLSDPASVLKDGFNKMKSQTLSKGYHWCIILPLNRTLVKSV